MDLNFYEYPGYDYPILGTTSGFIIVILFAYQSGNIIW